MQIELSPPQWEIFTDESRFKIAICGRRFGKTYLSIVTLLSWSQENEGIYFYVAPTFRMAKQIVWRDLKSIASSTNGVAKINESELSIELINGSVIALKGADNYDSLRGVSLSGLVMDEFADIKEDAWLYALRPACADRMAPVLFIGTPKGWNYAKDMYDRGLIGEHGYKSWMFTTADGGNVRAEEIEAARRELPEMAFKQEFMASFEMLANRVYSYFDRLENVQQCKDTGAELLIGMDFNVSPMTAVVGVRVADQLHIIDELELMNSNTEEMCAEIKRRYPKRRITVYPDPAGNARKTSATVGDTDFSIIRRHGFQLIAPKKHPLVVDRINTVQALLKNADGDRRLFIDPKCQALIKCLDGLTYKDGTSAPDKSLGLDHMTDGLGYLICQEFPISKKSFAIPVSFSM
ncbi:terminase-like family protein [Vibrio phage 1.228.O._10N.261.49.C1]|nr:terminase-like family protein [Vibrio phage 1.157.O._10N.261.45.B7]AUR96596.1 terminase-like family protein [Vibrio phage 1.228.O._10N.261.49.C1]